jgi:hypothetical protein
MRRKKGRVRDSIFPDQTRGDLGVDGYLSIQNDYLEAAGTKESNELFQTDPSLGFAQNVLRLALALRLKGTR